MLTRKRKESLLTGFIIFFILIVIGNGLRPDLDPIAAETQQRFREVALASVNAERKAQGIKNKVNTDYALQEWLDGQPESLINDAEGISPDLFLKRLPNKKLTLSRASLHCISADSPGSLAGQLDFWKEAFKSAFTATAGIK